MCVVHSGKQLKVTLDQFKGCFLGALLGDCLGHVFEGEYDVAVENVEIFFEKILGTQSEVEKLDYSDDTAMLKNVAKSLIENQDLNAVDMAKKFVAEYFDNPRRGYGTNVGDVFKKLREDKFKDVFQPAKEQFEGRGSYGNGGAMRVAPVSLFCHTNYKSMLSVAEKVTMITHTNDLAVNGALLQTVAVHQSLHWDKTEPINAKQFLHDLKQKMEKIEEKNSKKTYVEKINLIVNLLDKESVSTEEVVTLLGNGVAAHESVPTAVYVFLRALNPIPDFDSDNVVTRCIYYAISLGGDTDTIATMAGAIAGAHYGSQYIDSRLLKWAEDYDGVVDLAAQMYNIVEKQPDTTEV